MQERRDEERKLAGREGGREECRGGKDEMKGRDGAKNGETEQEGERKKEVDRKYSLITEVKLK